MGKEEIEKVENEAAEAPQMDRALVGVFSWLERTGFPLEDAAEMAFDEAGFSIERGWHYFDDERGELKARELDVIAHTRRGVAVKMPDGSPSMVTVTLALFVECRQAETAEEKKDKHRKAAKQEEGLDDRIGRPWVVFSTAHYSYDQGLVLPIISPLGEYAVQALVEHDRGRRLPLFWRPDRAAYRIASAHAPKGWDPAYENLNKAIKGACSWVPDALPLAFPLDLYIGFPVVVTGNDLVECWAESRTGRQRSISEKRPLKVERLQWRRLYWRGSSAVNGAVAVDIVTEGYLQKYADAMMRGCDQLVKFLEDNMSRWAEDILATGNLGELDIRLRQGRLRMKDVALERWVTQGRP